MSSTMQAKTAALLRLEALATEAESGLWSRDTWLELEGRRVWVADFADQGVTSVFATPEAIAESLDNAGLLARD